MAEIRVLLEGYRRFYAKHFKGSETVYETLATGQSPKILFIGCSDSRVDPSILTDSGPGDIFVIRNVANLVPPYQPDDRSYHGTSAALEFSVNGIGVKHIIVMGHGGCAGIKILVDSDDKRTKEFSFVDQWVHIASEAKERTIEKCKHSGQDKYHTCEREGVFTSLTNLMTFPWVKEKVESGELQLHGWHFSIDDGKLEILSSDEEYKDLLLDD